MSAAQTPFGLVNLLIVSPEEVIYEGQALWVQVPLEDGLIGIWPGHGPLIGALGSGAVQFDTGSQVREIPVAGGLLRVDQERCTILTDTQDLLGTWGSTREDSAPDLEVLTTRLEEVLQETWADEQRDEPPDG